MGDDDISVDILAIFRGQTMNYMLFIKIKFLKVHKNLCVDDTDFLMLKKRVMGGVSTKKFLVFSCLYRLRHIREM